jgi:hypothetical protein
VRSDVDGARGGRAARYACTRFSYMILDEVDAARVSIADTMF